MKPCPCCGNEPVQFFNFTPGYTRLHDGVCGYSTVPVPHDEAEAEWELITGLVAQWMKDKKIIKYRLDRFLEDEAHTT